MILDCMATWCGPCKVIAPQIVKMSNFYTDARFYKLDVDEVSRIYLTLFLLLSRLLSDILANDS